jgi:hypothetical protein
MRNKQAKNICTRGIRSTTVPVRDNIVQEFLTDKIRDIQFLKIKDNWKV